MLCDGNPDPLNTRELSTYMNLWRDDKEYKSVPVVLSESEGTLKVFEMFKFFFLIVYTHLPSVLFGFLTEVNNLISYFYSLILYFYCFNYSIYKTRHSISGNQKSFFQNIIG